MADIAVQLGPAYANVVLLTEDLRAPGLGTLQRRNTGFQLSISTVVPEGSYPMTLILDEGALIKIIEAAKTHAVDKWAIDKIVEASKTGAANG